MLRVLAHVRRAKLLDNSLDLIAFAWQAEREEELTDGGVDGQALIFEVRRVDLQHLLIHLVWRGQVLADSKFAQALGVEEELDYVGCTVRKQARIDAELDAFVRVFVEDYRRLLSQLLRLLLGRSFHDFCDQVLVPVLRCVPRVAKDAQLGNAWDVLRVVALCLAHRRHLAQKLVCALVSLALVTLKLLRPQAVNMISFFFLKVACAAKRRVADFLLVQLLLHLLVIGPAIPDQQPLACFVANGGQKTIVLTVAPCGITSKHPLFSHHVTLVMHCDWARLSQASDAVLAIVVLYSVPVVLQLYEGNLVLSALGEVRAAFLFVGHEARPTATHRDIVQIDELEGDGVRGDVALFHYVVALRDPQRRLVATAAEETVFLVLIPHDRVIGQLDLTRRGQSHDVV